LDGTLGLPPQIGVEPGRDPVENLRNGDEDEHRHGRDKKQNERGQQPEEMCR